MAIPRASGRSTFREWLAGKKPTERELSNYIGGLGEWWNSEFKAVATESDHVLRKAVCALANSRGGEVFLGVTDDRRIVGTQLTEQGINQVLRQHGSQTGIWYVVDMSTAVRQLTPVRLESVEAQLQAFVLEVVRVGLPVFLEEPTGELVLYLREGESSTKAGSFRALEWGRDLTREEILRTCYIELKTLSRVIGPQFVGLTAGLGLTLPYLWSRLEDGTFYRYLKDEDVLFILGRAKGGGYEGGSYRISLRPSSGSKKS